MTTSPYGWFDHFLKGEDNKVLEKMPQSEVLHDGLQQVAVVGYLASNGRGTYDALSGSGGRPIA